MGGGGPKVESPKPGPYEKELAKRLQRFAPYEEAFLREFAWSLPGAPGGPPAVPTVPTAPAATVPPATGPSAITPPVSLEDEYVKYGGTVLPSKEYQALWQEAQQLPPWELLKRMQEMERREEVEGYHPVFDIPSERLKYDLLKRAYEAKTKGYAAPATAPTTPVAPGVAQAPSPTRPPTYLLAPYMESIEREYSKAREAISGMRPGGARERAMLELEAYWKPQAKTAATRALYEEARATLASLVGGGYGPTLRTLVGLEQQRSAMEYQQRAAAAQASAAQQASMWQSIGSLAGLGILGFGLKGLGLFG